MPTQVARCPRRWRSVNLRRFDADARRTVPARAAAREELGRGPALALDGDVSAISAVRAAGTPLSDQAGPVGPEGVAAITNDPREATASSGLTVLLNDLTDEAIDAMLTWHATDAGAAVLLLGLRQLGGALDRPGRPAIASTRGAPWLMSVIAPLFPEVEGATRAALDQLREVLAPWAAPGGLPTFLGTAERLDRVFTPQGPGKVG